MKEILEFLEEIERLKFIPRSGWQYYGIKEPESVAEHSFLVAFLSLIVGLKLIKEGKKLNLEKMLIMALVHEIGEVRIGDIHLVAKRYLGFENVDNAEKKVAFELLDKLNLDEIKEIYEEFVNGKSEEAIIVRACDKLELFIQAYIYKKIGYNNIYEFFKADENMSEINKVELLNELYNLIKSFV